MTILRSYQYGALRRSVTERLSQDVRYVRRPGGLVKKQDCGRENTDCIGSEIVEYYQEDMHHAQYNAVKRNSGVGVFLWLRTRMRTRLYKEVKLLPSQQSPLYDSCKQLLIFRSIVSRSL